VSREIVDAAGRIEATLNSHGYVNEILAVAGFDRDAGLLRVADTMAATKAWDVYVHEIKAWIEHRTAAHHEIRPPAEVRRQPNLTIEGG
jgi:hypothetical protein